MDNQTILKQYLRSRPWATDIGYIIVSIMALFAPYILYKHIPTMDPLRLIGLTILSLCIVGTFGYLLSIKNLLKIPQNAKHIQTGAYDILEDTITGKTTEKGPFFRKLYILEFQTYSPEKRPNPYKNGILVSKRAYNHAQIGDRLHLLIIEGNGGYMSCFVNQLKFDIPALLEKSDYIQSKCINEKRKTESPLHSWTHALPLKDSNEYYLTPENWNLPEEDLTKIKTYQDELGKYAYNILSNCPKGPGEYPGALPKNCLQNITDFLPPWIVAPLLNASSIHWRMGKGECYLYAYHQFLNTLTDEELRLYKETYPKPCHLKAWGHQFSEGGIFFTE